jgi:hypothetical protein
MKSAAANGPARPNRCGAAESGSPLIVLPWAIQKPDSIAQHRPQVIHPIEQFDALVFGGIPKALHHVGKIEADGFNRFLQGAPLIAGRALGLTRPPNLGKVYYLCHDTIILADFLADVTLVLDYFASTFRKPLNLMRETVKNFELARVHPGAAQQASQREHDTLRVVGG